MADKKYYIVKRDYYITERQLVGLMDLLDGYEAAPKAINEAVREEYEAEGGDHWGDITDMIDGYLCEFNRELHFLIEDIEAQEIVPDIAKGHMYDKWEGAE